MRRQQFRPAWLTPWLLLGLVACGGGGDSISSGGSGTLNPDAVGFLQIVSAAPADDAVQVALRPELSVSFDAPIETGALNTAEFKLRVLNTEPTIDGTFTTKNNGKTVVFVPTADLQRATDYEFVLAPTIVDTDYRATDQEYRLRFRTLDDIPPVVLSSSVANNASGLSRTASITVQFDERLDDLTTQGAVALRDPWGSNYDVEVAHAAGVVTITPAHDLPGLASFTLSIRGGANGIKDRSGNALAADWTRKFTTEFDGTAPRLLSSDPDDTDTGVSPLARIALHFDESMDDESFDPSGLLLIDADLNPVTFTVSASRDHKTIYLMPTSSLTPSSSYEIQIKSNATGLTDFSGNSLAVAQLVRFQTGTDTTPPEVTTSVPAANATRVSPNVVIDVRFDGALEPSTVSRDTVTLTQGTTSIYVTPSLGDGNRLLSVIPSKFLEPNTTYTLRLLGGYDGIQDIAGNPLATDHVLTFTTSGSSVLPQFVISPGHATYGVPNTSRLTILANEALDPGTVNSTTVQIEDSVSGAVPGTLQVVRANRGIVFTPTAGFTSGATITVRILGEASGLRLASGNWPTTDTTATFGIGFSSDNIPPEMTLTINEVAESRQNGLVVPPFGFTIDVTMQDAGNFTVDPTSLEFELTGPGSVPSSDELFATGKFTASSGQLQLDEGLALAEGLYTLRTRVFDLSGNPSAYETIQFEVMNAGSEFRPFERLQIVWVRFDMDREGNGGGNGTKDFDEDLYDYGLLTQGDPSGTNERMRTLVVEAIVRRAHLLYGRTESGGPQENSIPIRLVLREPSTAPHMRIAVGGKDPDGAPNRDYGADSSGILGRAFYDYRNSTPTENNTGTSPGVGVFPGELFLYQARLYLDLYPYFLTSFGLTFRGLSPHMGGTPVGSHAEDVAILDPLFVYGSATASQQSRYNEVMRAADDFASAIGIVLAHEIGHSLGLTAPGACPSGLHGDSSLHNASSSFTDVMSAVISYESLVTMDFEFRPLNLAYLRERILTR